MGFVLTDAEQAYHYGEELSHYGVPGMKWGKRKAGASAGPSGPSRKDLRGMDKVSRGEDKAARRKASDDRDASIVKARTQLVKKGENLRAAKKTYKAEKKQIGKVAARRALDRSKEDFNKSWDLSQQPTRKEANRNAVIYAVSAAGMFTLQALAGS